MKSTITVMFLASNPRETPALALDEEIRSITRNLRSAEYRDAFTLISGWALRPDDLLQELNTHNPTVVHFSGHGSSAGELILSDDTGRVAAVSPVALTALFGALRQRVRLVVLNACYSQVQAKAIAAVADCVIGMTAPIGDHAATVFSASLYRALGFGCSVKQAFDQGIAALLLERIAEEKIPAMVTRQGVDPAGLFLVATDPNRDVQHRPDPNRAALNNARRLLEILEERCARFPASSLPAHLQLDLEAQRASVLALEARLNRRSDMK